MNSTTLEYLAGFIDGEGCIAIGKHLNNRGINYGLSLLIVNTNKKIIDIIHEQYGGGIYKSDRAHLKNHKDAWLWSLTSTKAVELLRKVQPYLIIKREQALLGIEFGETLSSKHKIVSEDLRIIRQEMYLKMKKLNKKGV